MPAMPATPEAGAAVVIGEAEIGVVCNLEEVPDKPGSTPMDGGGEGLGLAAELAAPLLLWSASSWLKNR